MVKNHVAWNGFWVLTMFLGKSISWNPCFVEIFLFFSIILVELEPSNLRLNMFWHGTSKTGNPSTTQMRSNVRVAPNLFKWVPAISFHTGSPTEGHGLVRTFLPSDMYNNAVKAMQKHMVKKGPADSSEFHGSMASPNRVSWRSLTKAACCAIRIKHFLNTNTPGHHPASLFWIFWPISESGHLSSVPFPWRFRFRMGWATWAPWAGIPLLALSPTHRRSGGRSSRMAFFWVMEKQPTMPRKHNPGLWCSIRLHCHGHFFCMVNRPESDDFFHAQAAAS